MRIAIVHENWGAGAARCARDLEAGLGRNHDVLYHPPRSATFGNKMQSTESILRILADFAPDLVNCHSFYSGLPYESLAEMSARYPVCFTVHDPRPIGTMDPTCWDCDWNGWCLRCPLATGPWQKGRVARAKRAFNTLAGNDYFRQRMRKRACHNRCAKDMTLVAPSQWMAKRLGAQELRRFRIDTIPYGIDLKRFHPGPSQRERFGLPPDVPVLLHSAWYSKPWELNERKGLRYLAKAFMELVLPRFPNAILAVAGEYLAPNHPNVRGLGMVSQEDLPALLNSVDVFILPTLADNLPYTILEAMGCGLPVVAFAVGGVPEEIVDGETGRLVPLKEYIPLGKALVEIMSEPEKLRAAGRAARERAERLFAMDPFVHAYESLFAEMIAKRQSSVAT